jgi:hypothetical protein
MQAVNVSIENGGFPDFGKLEPNHKAVSALNPGHI